MNRLRRRSPAAEAVAFRRSIEPMFLSRFTPKIFKRWARYYDIARVLSRHGFYGVAMQMRLVRFFPLGLKKRIESARDYELPIPVRIRRAIEELGPTYVKTGQIMSSRPDLLPPDVIRELSKLQDDVPPFPFEQVKELVEKELKRPMDAVFSSFTERPVASASVGQVHEATLADGREAVVKVQRPGIEKIVEADADIMRAVARRAERTWDFVRRQNLADRVEEFVKVIREEMDYLNEAKNAERLKKNFGADETIYIPAIHWDCTTRRVLTMERIRGIKIKDKDRLLEKGYDLAALTEIIAKAYLKQVLLDGVFHGDPHSGNIFVMEGGVVALIDFGMVGLVDPMMKRNMARYFIALVNQDPEGVVEVLNEIADIDPSTNQDALTREVGRMMAKYANVKLGQIRFEEIALELLQLSIKYKVGMPGEFTLMDKTFITLEGLGRHLDPEFDLIAVAAPMARTLFQRDLNPRHVGSSLLRASLDGQDLLQHLPRRLDKITKQLEKGRLTVRVDQEPMADAVNRLARSVRRASNKLSLGIVAAALILAVPHMMDKTVPILGRQVSGARVSFMAFLVIGTALIAALIGSRRDRPGR